MYEQPRYSRRKAVLTGLAALGGVGTVAPRLLHAGGVLAASGRTAGDAGASGATALAADTRGFGFRLFDQLAAQQASANVFISPPSIATALAMVCNGARGATAQALAAALGVPGMSPDQMNRQTSALLTTLQGLDPHVQLTIADSLWARQGITFNPAFVNAITSFYRARATTLNFQDPHAATTINNWVSQATHGKIDRIIGDRIDSNAILFLLNAIYFKGRWTNPFDKGQTAPGAFTLSNGRQKTLPMMTQTGHLPYYRGAGFQAVGLPYGAGKLHMYVLLPDQNSGLTALRAALNSDRWDTWMSRFQSSYGTITLPRFKVSYEAMPNLNGALTALGMGIAFDPKRADFGGIAMAPRPFINEVRHRAVMEVNEEGTTAAGVTSIGVGVTAAELPQFTMVVNRPFICAIRDATTGTVLFLGSIVDPA
jgi:serine protease inhibitor